MLATVASERNNTLLLIPTLKALKNMLSLTKNVSRLSYCQQITEYRDGKNSNQTHVMVFNCVGLYLKGSDFMHLQVPSV